MTSENVWTINQITFTKQMGNSSQSPGPLKLFLATPPPIPKEQYLEDTFFLPGHKVVGLEEDIIRLIVLFVPRESNGPNL